MSQNLINRNPDLRQLADEGLDLEIKNGVYLLVHGIPYVNARREIAFGVLVSKLELAGEKTVNPVKDHVVHFVGDHPCQKDGNIITAIKNASNTQDLGGGVVINHTFSNKFPDRKYNDYHEKVVRYVKIILHEAQAINPKIKPLSPTKRESNGRNTVFHYPDTNSGRAEIGAISEKLQNLKVAIVGLGGTGSYVLDFLAKTHVKEIHLFDGDIFLNHNAFRAPGAATLDELNEKQKKVAYLHGIYSRMRMHESIVPHDYHVTAEVVEELSGMDFVFMCVDNPKGKELIIAKLIEKQIRFIDVGIGVSAIDGALTGSLRTTACSDQKSDHISRRISFADAGENDYSLNIQIAELNALNAALAVVKWKKMFGFYHDLGKEHNSSYSINVNKIINDEIVA